MLIGLLLGGGANVGRAQSYAYFSPTNPAAYVPVSKGAGGPAVFHRNGITYVAVWESSTNWYPHVSRTDESTGQSEVVPMPGAETAPAGDGHFAFELKMDAAGYLHAVQVGHNTPLTYWKSNLPDSIAGGFTIIAPNTTNGLPWGNITSDYAKLLTDNNGVLFMVLRCDLNNKAPDQGHRGVVLYRYDLPFGRWTLLGGLQSEHPAATIAAPAGAGTLRGRALFWEWGGQTDTLFYQGFSANLTFDPQNRMHFTVTTWDRFPDQAVVNGDGDTLVYAYSDDAGETWKRSDGSLISHLPMRGRAGLPNSADVVYQGDPANNDGRLGLQTQIVADRAGKPLVAANDTYTRSETGWTPSVHGGNSLLPTTPNSRHLLGADGRLYTFRQPLIGGGTLRALAAVDSGYARFFGSPGPLPNTLGGDAATFRKTGLLFGTIATNTYYARVGITPGWYQADLGTPLNAGISASLPFNALRIRASGGDLTSASDQARFTWQTVSGNAVILARLDTHTATNPAAWAGLTIRESTNANSRHATVVAMPGQGFRFVTRSTTGATAQTSGANPALFAPERNWLRLTRTGTTITAEVSGDAVTWTLLGSTTLALPTDALVGLVASANAGMPADFHFSQLGIQGLRNLAFGKPATASSQYYDLGAGLATDGGTNGDWNLGSVAMTYNTDATYFWRVDLEDLATVQTLKFYKRTDGNRDGMLNSATVRLLGATSNVLWTGSIPAGALAFPDTLTPGGVANVRYVELQRSSQIAVAEVEVLGTNSVPMPGPDLVAPDAPANLNAVARDSSVTLTWSPAAAADVVGYVLERGPSGSGPFTVVANDIFLPRFTDTGLALGSNYYYRVAAFDAAGNRSDHTAPLLVTTVDRTPPAPPIITSLNYGDSSLTLGWTALEPQPDFSHWELVRADRRGQETILVASTTGTNYTWTAAGPGQYSEFFLRAYDLSGNRSGAGNVISYLSGTNLALGQPATQGANSGTAARAVDGVVLGSNSTDTGNATNLSVNWWQVDLGADRPIGAIELFCHQSDPNGLIAFDVLVIGNGGQTNWMYSHPLGYYIGFMQRLYPDGVMGRHVRVQRRDVAVANPAALRLAEVRVLEQSAGWPAVPPVLGGRVLHLDAGDAGNLQRDGYRVTTWTNRAPGGGSATQAVTNSQPRIGSSGALERHLVNFGGDASGRWMKFKTAAGADWRPTNLRTIFWVVKGANFLLGDGVEAAFHRGTAAEGQPHATIWDGLLASPAVLGGETYLNGVLINGATTPLPDTYSVVSLVTTAAVAADRIGDDRNNPARQGGLQLAELIAYDTALSASERQQTEAYLMEKWNIGRHYGATVPIGLGAAAVSSSQINLSWSALAGATSYNVKRGTNDGGPYAVIAAGVNGTTYADAGRAAATDYYYVVSANTAAGESASSGQASARTFAWWQAQDVGAVVTPGSASESGGVFTMSGAGADIGGTADAFHFVYGNLTGDGTLLARLAGHAALTPGSKLGIAMRETLDAGAKSVAALFDDGQNKARLGYRPAANGGTTYLTPISTTAVPVWFKLERAGDDFTGSYSSDGTNWIVLGTANVAMSNSIYVGLIVCSRNSSVLNTATFDHVGGSAWGAAPLPPPVATDLIYTVSGGQLILNWPPGQGWRLETQTNELTAGLTTQWITVSNAVPPYTNALDSATPTRFYRLKYP